MYDPIRQIIIKNKKLMKIENIFLQINKISLCIGFQKPFFYNQNCINRDWQHKMYPVQETSQYMIQN